MFSGSKVMSQPSYGKHTKNPSRYVDHYHIISWYPVAENANCPRLKDLCLELKGGTFQILSSANEVTSHKEELNSRTAVSWGSCFIYGNIFGDLCISRDTVQYPMIAAGSPSNISPLLKCHVLYFSQCIGANTLNPKSPPCKKFNTSHYFIPPRQILDIQTTSRRHWRNNYDNRE